IVAFDVLGGRRQALDELGAVEVDAAVARLRQPAAEIADLVGRTGGGAHDCRRRPRMLSRNDEKKIWIPTMTSVAASTARRSSESAARSLWIQIPTITAATTSPASVSTPPSSRPCSRRNRARIRSNHASLCPMKYMP